MTWTLITHPRCIKPLFGLAFTPHGSIWTCDTCGKKWMVDRSTKPASWLDVGLDAVLARLNAQLSMEPADVGARELAAGKAWVNRRFDDLYAELGLERSR